MSAEKSMGEDRFNLLLITIDTLRTDRLSCYSPEHLKTPNIDSLAAKSVVFTRAFAHTSTTLAFPYQYSFGHDSALSRCS